MSDDLHKWLQKAIGDGHINYYEPDEFLNKKPIGEGGFGVVDHADWKGRYMQVAIKALKPRPEMDYKRFVTELKVLRKVSYCPNINQFCGVTRNPDDKRYALVLQYAEENLNNYLKRTFSELKWNSKLKIAKEISIGLACLHEENIIHRDLHAMNVLVQNNTMVISDFGLSKFEESKAHSSTKVYGQLAYLDPIIKKRSDITRQSDIFSLGVLFWQISSGKTPLERESTYRKKALMSVREWDPHVKDVPERYKQLIDKCREEKPQQRPDIHEVMKELQSIEKEIEKETATIDISLTVSNAGHTDLPRNGNPAPPGSQALGVESISVNPSLNSEITEANSHVEVANSHE